MTGNKEGDAEVTRPITFYVSKVSTATLSIEKIQSELAIDIELSQQDAEKLIDILTERTSQEIPGTLRVRLFGRLVIG